MGPLERRISGRSNSGRSNLRQSRRREEVVASCAGVHASGCSKIKRGLDSERKNLDKKDLTHLQLAVLCAEESRRLALAAGSRTNDFVAICARAPPPCPRQPTELSGAWATSKPASRTHVP